LAPRTVGRGDVVDEQARQVEENREPRDHEDDVQGLETEHGVAVYLPAAASPRARSAHQARLLACQTEIGLPSIFPRLAAAAGTSWIICILRALEFVPIVISALRPTSVDEPHWRI